MPPNLILKIHGVTDVRSANRLLGPKTPELYVSIKIKTSECEHRRRTKGVRDLTAQWEEEFILHAIEKDHDVRFRLKAACGIMCDRIIGEAECKVSALLPSPGTPTIQKDIGLHNINDAKERRLTGMIMVTAESTHELRREAGEAALLKVKDVREQRRGPGSLFEKVGKLQEKLEILNGIVSTIDELAKLHPLADIAWRICKSLYTVVASQHSTDQKMFDLVDTLEATLDFVDDAGRIKEDAIPLQPFIRDLLQVVVECAYFISAYLQRDFAERVGKRLLADPNPKVAEFTDKLTKLRESLKEKVQLHTGLVGAKTLEIVKELREFNVLSALKPTDMIATDRPQCLDGTRRDVLRDIVDWIADMTHSEQNVLWLHGLAGSGKSTIANTVASRVHEMNRLGGFLFFERDKTERSTVIHTIASQLADANPVLYSKIGAVIKHDRHVVRGSLVEQFTHLIHGPLVDAAESLLGPIVIVIDALDEFGDANSRRSFLTLISDEFTKLPNNFRFLITSRPESDIESLFSINPRIKSTSLSNMKDAIPEVRLYLSSELADIRYAKRMPDSWPEEYYLDRAAEMSEGLFIWASTLSKFLWDATYPDTQLKSVLSSENKKHAKGLDNLYATVLSGRNDWDEGLNEKFREVAGIVLFCHIPISDVVVDQLLGLPKTESSRYIFKDFHCLFDYTPGWPIRPLHASFRDYLTDEDRSGGEPWSLVGFDAHHHLTMCCFRVMSNQLRFNICRLETSHCLNENYIDIEERIKDNISPALQYASIHWPDHLREIPTFSDDVASALRSFSKAKLFFWLEVVSLTGCSGSLEAMYDEVQKYVRDNDIELLTVWESVHGFIEDYSTVIRSSAPHIYVSALLFFPRLSPLKQTHASLFRHTPIQSSYDFFPGSQLRGSSYLSCSPDGQSLLLRLGNYLAQWYQCRLVGDKLLYCDRSPMSWPFLENRRCSPDNETISPDHRRAAGNIGRETICVWEVETGDVEVLLQGSARRFAFHPSDSNLMASVDGNNLHSSTDDRNSDITIRIWDLAWKATRIIILLKYPSVFRPPLVWSPDGIYLALRTYSNVFVWRIDTTTCAATLERRFDLDFYFEVGSLCFSPTTQSHILLSSKRGVSLYDFKTGCQISGPYVDDPEHKALFSPDGSLVMVYAQRLFTIKVFETETGRLYQDPILAPNRVERAIFLPNGEHIAVITGNSIHTWRLCHNFQISDEAWFDRANSEGHLGEITSVSFSPDGTKLLSSSMDGTIHVRSAADCMLLREYWPMKYSCAVDYAVFGVDSKTIYLALADGTICKSSGEILYRRPDPSNRDMIHRMHVYMSEGSSQEYIVVQFQHHNKLRGVILSGDGGPNQQPRSVGPVKGTGMSVSLRSGLLACVSSWTNIIEFTNIEEGYVPGPIQTDYTMPVTEIVFSHKGKVLVSAGAYHLHQDYGNCEGRCCGIHVWDVKTSECLTTLATDDIIPADIDAMNISVDDNVLAVAFALPFSSACKAISLWSLQSGTLLRRWDPLLNLAYIMPNQLEYAYIGVGLRELVIVYDNSIARWDLSALQSDVQTPHSDIATTRDTGSSAAIPFQWSAEKVDLDDFGIPNCRGAWILGPNKERLLWVPIERWADLDLVQPGSTHVIRRKRLGQKLALSDFMDGEKWLKDYGPCFEKVVHVDDNDKE